MKKILFCIAALYFVSCAPAFAYIYHCPSTSAVAGDREMWPEVYYSDPSVMGTYHFVGADYDFMTGESMCHYACSGCDSQGYCACNKDGSMMMRGKLVEPIVNDITKWKRNLKGDKASCSIADGGSCPWKIKASS